MVYDRCNPATGRRWRPKVSGLLIPACLLVGGNGKTTTSVHVYSFSDIGCQGELLEGWGRPAFFLFLWKTRALTAGTRYIYLVPTGAFALGIYTCWNRP